MSFIEAGPDNSLVKSNVNFYIPEPNILLCQPSLASHAVLTSTIGISFVWGWEACNLNDTKRIDRTLRSYASGIEHGVYKNLVKYAGLEGSLQISKEIDKSLNSGHSGLSEHLYAFQQSEQKYSEQSGQCSSKCGRKSDLAGASKRLQRSLRFPNNKRKHLEGRSNREGSYSNSTSVIFLNVI